jgi:hypothetical protein
VAKKKKTPLFQVTDYFGNLVVLHEDWWIGHILDPNEGHPQMVGYENLVQRVVHDPFEVRLSTKASTGAVFISDVGVGPSPEGIRVVVGYPSITFEKGGGHGTVITAYPIDLVRYSTPRIGKIIGRRGR